MSQGVATSVTLHRVLALDVLVALLIALLIIFSYLRDVSHYIDAALSLALLLHRHPRRRPLRHARRTVLMLGVLGTALLAVGLILATIGLYGLLRMPDIFDQLHAAGLITGPALIVMLLAALASGSAEIITSAALVLVFLLVTSPLSSGHAIAQAARRRPARRPESQPADASKSE